MGPLIEISVGVFLGIYVIPFVFLLTIGLVMTLIQATIFIFSKVFKR